MIQQGAVFANGPDLVTIGKLAAMSADKVSEALQLAQYQLLLLIKICTSITNWRKDGIDDTGWSVVPGQPNHPLNQKETPKL